MFAAREFPTVSLSQRIRHLPKLMVKHDNLHRSEIDGIADKTPSTYGRVARVGLAKSCESTDAD